MTPIVLRNRAKGIWVMAALNLLVLAAFAFRWIQGDPRLGIRILTLVAAVLLVLKVRTLIRPVELRLVDGRLSGRVGMGGAFSTPSANVLRLEPAEGGLILEFRDLAAVEVGDMFRTMFERNHAEGGAHLRVPLKAKPEDVERFRAAVAKGPSGN